MRFLFAFCYGICFVGFLNYTRPQRSSRLFKDLTVSNLLELAVDLNRLVPRPDILNKGLVLGLGDVKLGVVVRLPIRSNIKSRSKVLASDEESTNDTVIVVLTGNNSATKHVLGGSRETVEETTNKVVGHEGKGKLVVVLVSNLPEGPLLRLVVAPEPRESSLTGLLVGVDTLPLVKNELRLGEERKGVDLLLLLGGLISSRGLLLGSRGSLGGSLGLLLLLGGSVLDGLLTELELSVVLSKSILLDQGREVSGKSGVGLDEVSSPDRVETTSKNGNDNEVSSSDTLTNKVSVLGKVLLQNVSVGLSLGDTSINGLLVVGGAASDGEDGRSNSLPDILVGERSPLKNRGVVLLGGAKKGRLLQAGNWKKKIRISNLSLGWRSKSLF